MNYEEEGPDPTKKEKDQEIEFEKGLAHEKAKREYYEREGKWLQSGQDCFPSRKV